MRPRTTLLHVSMQPRHISYGALRLQLTGGRYIGAFVAQANRYHTELKRRELANEGIYHGADLTYDLGPDIDTAVARLRPFFHSASYYFSLEPGSSAQIVVHVKRGLIVHVAEVGGSPAEKLDEPGWHEYAAALTNGQTPDSRWLLAAGLVVERVDTEIIGTFSPDQANYAFALAIAKLHP